MSFADRRAAGVILGQLVATENPVDPIVLALPRGGVPVGFEVARALDCPLDVLIVRKIGVPRQPELAMGAVAEGGVIVRNEDVIRFAAVDETAFGRVAAEEELELERRLEAYRGEVESPTRKGRTAVLVDDGLATGSTALAAVATLQRTDVGAIWVAVPVAPRDTTANLESEADRVFVVETPRHFGAVGAWYDDFAQTTDEEVRSLLRESRLR